ncbi:MAG: 50S ribosomal protein L28 [Planctomycetota bacterium]|nr:50S ribosomal protein L28 [Planctomycetota bacterium]
MPRVCAISGKKTTIGRQYTTRGMAKSKGGVGTKITGKNPRKFKPNLQRVRVLVNGRTVRMKVAAKFIRRGMVQKPPLKRRKDKAALAYHGEAQAPT